VRIATLPLRLLRLANLPGYCFDDVLCVVWCFDMLFLLGHVFGASGVPQLLGCSAVGV